MAYDFDGTNDRIDYGTGGGVGAGSDWSVSAWVNPDDFGNYNSIVTKRSAFGAGTNQFSFVLNQTNGLVTASRDATASDPGLLIPTTGIWNHCGVACHATGADFYLNGSTAPGGNNMQSGSNTNQPLNVGSVGDPGDYMDGKIAEVGIWNVRLTTAEMAMLNAGYSPLFVRPENLVHYFPLARHSNDVVGGLVGTVTEAAVYPHPRIIYPKRRA